MTDIQIPPYPATVDEAKRQANDLAYGFEKHTDDYWNALYLTDPEYAWKRMLGWQAGPEDAAKFGFYANPQTPWHGTVAPPVVVPPAPEPPPVSPPWVTPDQLAAGLAEIKTLIAVAAARPAPSYSGTVNNRYLGSISIHLDPK